MVVKHYQNTIYVNKNKDVNIRIEWNLNNFFKKNYYSF